MKLLSTYDRIKSADGRCKEIVKELQVLKTEYHPKEVRSLVKEYQWTIGVIIRLCDDILNESPEDEYGEEIDFRIKLSYFQEYYENIRDKIKK